MANLYEIKEGDSGKTVADGLKSNFNILSQSSIGIVELYSLVELATDTMYQDSVGTSVFGGMLFDDLVAKMTSGIVVGRCYMPSGLWGDGVIINASLCYCSPSDNSQARILMTYSFFYKGDADYYSFYNAYIELLKDGDGKIVCGRTNLEYKCKL